ncbi:winged helix-turn-helix transcriptional regulator [Candidatus Fermentibacteria bacterium]|nr:winged helix-turn-helix transcriptional regulator [Candidatus Fermentibacteria bacterium]
MVNTARDLARLMKVLSADARVRIVQLLKERPLCVNALAARLGVTQGAVSQHLRIMRDAGLVVDEKHGYFTHYRLNQETLAAWREVIDELLDSPEAGADTKGALPCAAVTRRTRAARSQRT